MKHPPPSLVSAFLQRSVVCCCLLVAARASTADLALDIADEAYVNWQKNPKSSALAAEYAQALAGAGQWQKALSAIGELINEPTLSPSRKVAMRMDAGYCFTALRRWKDAEAEFQRILMLSNQSPGTVSASQLKEARKQLVSVQEWRTWTPLESKYFVFYFQPGVTADTPEERRSFVYISDLSYETICRALQGSLAAKIHYFAYKDSESLMRLTGMSASVLGLAETFHYRVHYIDRPSQHEMTHMISLHTCPDQLGLAAFSEGLAVYFDWSGNNVHEFAAKAIDPEALSRILSARNSMSLASLKSGYVLAASFLGHLLESYPWPTVSAFCSNCKKDPDLASLLAFKRPLEVIAAEWQARVELNARLARDEEKALTLPAEQAEPVFRESVKQDRFRLHARMNLGELLSDRGKWQEARDALNEAWQVIMIRGWSPSLIGQLTADLAYAQAQLGDFKQARYFNDCTVQIREPTELLAWAQAASGRFKKKEVPIEPPPRVKGRKWNTGSALGGNTIQSSPGETNTAR